MGRSNCGGDSAIDNPTPFAASATCSSSPVSMKGSRNRAPNNW